MGIVTLVFGVMLMILSLVLFAKNIRTHNLRGDINYAIYRYRIDCVEKGVDEKVDWDDMASYEHSLFRLWDWSNKNIVSKEKYEIIEPYLRRRTR